MPHLTLEYTNNLPQFNVDNALLELNKALVNSGQFDEIDIKSRAIQLNTYLVGAQPDGRGFAHVKLAIMSGRPTQTKRELSENLLRVLKQIWKPTPELHIQLCVEIVEMDREVYGKTIVCS